MNALTAAASSSDLRPYPAALEWLKLAAFAAMLADHWELIVQGTATGPGHAIGRFAFPAFCLAFGMGLAYTRRPAVVGGRLLLVGAVSSAVWLMVKAPTFANVLVLFAWFAFVVAADAHRPLQAVLLAGLVFFCLAGRIEGGVVGPALLAAGFLASRERAQVVALLLALLWALLAAELGAFVAVLAFGLCLVHGSGPTWRTGPALLWLYPAHLAAFWTFTAAQ